MLSSANMSSCNPTAGSGIIRQPCSLSSGVGNSTPVGSSSITTANFEVLARRLSAARHARIRPAANDGHRRVWWNSPSNASQPPVAV
eukprot:5277628-Prymnesium_polylepis.1